MTGSRDTTSDGMERANRRGAWAVTAVVFGMLGLSFAAVPLYDLFCRTTGFGGTPMVAREAAKSIGTKTYTVRFDVGVSAGLNWQFDSERASIEVKPGQVTTVHYTVRNTGPQDSTGIASFNVLPEVTGGYFNKLECFCFTEQTLKPGESREETVVFFLDPEIEKDKALSHVDTITLSYTFHTAKTPSKPIAANAGRASGTVQ